MKYEIMLQILFLLLAREKVSAKYMAQRFNVSVRSIMRYIDVMCVAGIPIIADSGRNGGYYIAGSYKLPASFMSEKEFNAVISTLTSYNEQVENRTLSSAVEKLQSIKRQEKQIVNVRSGNLVIDGSSWNGNDNVKNIVTLISNAIEDCFVTGIGYSDKHGKETTRLIEPHAIVLKQGLWYVYAYCRLRNEFRMFKASRISYADVKEEVFKKRNIEIKSLTSGRWFKDLPSENIELSVSKRALTDVEEWLGVGAVYKKGEEYFASATLPYDNWLISKILGFGGQVKVLAPEKLKNDLSSWAKSVISLYEEN